MHTVPQKKASDPRDRFSQHLSRSGQKAQLFANLKECAPPPGIASTYTTVDAVYSLIRCYAVLGQGKDIEQFQEEGNYTQKLFHGTKEVYSCNIVLQGFKLPKLSGMFGKAVYLSPDIKKTFGYTDKLRPVIFVCEAALGRVQLMEEGCSTLSPTAFDTAFGKAGYTTTISGGKLNFNEYAVFDPDRIRIKYLLEFDRKR